MRSDDVRSAHGPQATATARTSTLCAWSPSRTSRKRSRNVIDPELGLDFVELGLIYDIEIDGGNVHVTFTLTAPGCPIGPEVSSQIEEFVSELDGVESVALDDGVHAAVDAGADERRRQVRAGLLTHERRHRTGACASTSTTPRHARPAARGAPLRARARAAGRARRRAQPRRRHAVRLRHHARLDRARRGARSSTSSTGGPRRDDPPRRTGTSASSATGIRSLRRREPRSSASAPRPRAEEPRTRRDAHRRGHVRQDGARLVRVAVADEARARAASSSRSSSTRTC